jgi:hypothetical protein
MSRTRIALGAAGVTLGLFGVFRLLTQVSGYDLIVLFCWLIGALVIHDGLLSPLIAGIGVAVHRLVPGRARRYLQGGLVAGALVTVVAAPLIYRQGSQPEAKAILQQHFGANLATLLALVAGLVLLLYVVRVLRDHHEVSTAKARPSHDQSSDTE